MIRNLFIFLIIYPLLTASCSTKIISNNYYQEQKENLDKIEGRYEKLNPVNPFSLAFTDKDFSIISLEMISDTLTRIYEFNVNEQRLADTLLKYNYDTAGIYYLIRKMQETKVTWINNFDYYVNDQPQQLIILSIKPVTIRYIFSPPKYIALAYFRTAQFFDEKGRLLDSRRTKQLRKIKGQVFYKITDRICYTITEKYR
ncbi:MAG TPA: hypothetical protein VKB95_15125 [Chitinophagaceae bacterium]|nr:hypothetical protein [Chitinophagaceae bacterium]